MRLNQYEWDPDIDLIAEGAFAEVFKAKDTNSHNRHVALKIYKEAVVRGTAASAGHKKYTLENEFQNVDGLSHSNIITYFGLDYITHTDAMGRSSKYAVLIMEYANAGTLQGFLKTTPSKEILDKIIEDVILGLDYLHSEGVIHRDLKPGNILITKNRKGIPIAKITDFGISKDTLTEDTIQQSMTAGVGTPHYMAPEQIYKKRFGLHGEISTRTDIWGLGVVIYRILTGKLPFGNGSKDYELVRDAITNESPNFDEIPSKYKEMLKSCFHKEAVKRPSSARDLLPLLKSKPIIVAKESLENDLEETQFGAVEEDGLETVVAPVISEAAGIVKPKRPKWQKIVVLFFGLLNIGGSVLVLIPQDRKLGASLVAIAYAISVFTITFCFLKERKISQFVQLLLYGFLLFVSTSAMLSASLTLFSGLKMIQILPFFCGVVIHFLFTIWLSIKELKIKDHYNKDKSTAFLLLFILVAYLSSYFLSLYDNTPAIGIIFSTLLYGKWSLFTLFANILLMTAMLAFYSGRHTHHLKSLFVIGILSITMASSWWLFLDTDQGYISSLANEIEQFSFLGSSKGYYKVHIQEYQISYYVWLLTIIATFCIVLYLAVRKHAYEKYYWPTVLGTMVLLGGLFAYKYSKSIVGYDLAEGVKNLNYVQFKNALDEGADLDWNPTVMSTILDGYTENNAYKVERMTETFYLQGWNGSLDEKRLSLQKAIETNNTKILEQVLNSDARTFVNDTIASGRSMIRLAKDQENKEIANLLIKAGALDVGENAFLYFDNFTNGSTEFEASSGEINTWSFKDKAYQILVNKTGYIHYQFPLFNLDPSENYTVEVTASSSSNGIGYGICFDATNSTNRHTLTLKDNILELEVTKENVSKSIRKIEISKRIKNVLKVYKRGNMVSCYLNGKEIFKDQQIESIGGRKLGFVVKSAKALDVVQFDNFRIVGAEK